VNFHKSSLIGINLDIDDFTTGMANSIYCKWDTLPTRYRGLPLGVNPKRYIETSNLSDQIKIWKLERKVLKHCWSYMSVEKCVDFPHPSLYVTNSNA